MKNTGAREFLQAWRQITSQLELEKQLLDNWTNLEKYTALIQEDVDCVIDRVAKKLNSELKCYNEYYCTDAVLFFENDLVPETKTGTTWLRGINVTFEHEHIYNKRLYEEISHLLILHSALSVIVTYPPPGDVKNLEHLPYFHSLIKDSRRAKELDEKENFLLIFGYRSPLQWKGLIFKNDGWKEIVVTNPTEVAIAPGAAK